MQNCGIPVTSTLEHSSCAGVYMSDWGGCRSLLHDIRKLAGTGLHTVS